MYRVGQDARDIDAASRRRHAHLASVARQTFIAAGSRRQRRYRGGRWAVAGVRPARSVGVGRVRSPQTDETIFTEKEVFGRNCFLMKRHGYNFAKRECPIQTLLQNLCVLFFGKVVDSFSLVRDCDEDAKFSK